MGVFVSEARGHTFAKPEMGSTLVSRRSEGFSLSFGSVSVMPTVLPMVSDFVVFPVLADA